MEVTYKVPAWSGASKTPYILTATHNEEVLVEWDLSGSASVTIGRDRTCDVQVSHPSLSKLHAVLQFKHGGEVYLFDMESRNGTVIGSQSVAANIFLPLRLEKSVFKFGNCSWQFRVRPKTEGEEIESGVLLHALEPVDFGVETLCGEVIVDSFPGVNLMTLMSCPIMHQGLLLVTNYAIRFVDERQLKGHSNTNASEEDSEMLERLQPVKIDIEIAFSAIANDVSYSPAGDGGDITFYLKDFRVITFRLPSVEVFDTLVKMAFPFFRDSFCLSFKTSPDEKNSKWKLHSWGDQLKREGLTKKVDDRPWSVLRLANVEFESPAYFNSLILPTPLVNAVKGGDLTSVTAASVHRDGGLFPVYTWGCWDPSHSSLYGAVMLRGRRPKFALLRQTATENIINSEDYEMMEALHNAVNWRHSLDHDNRLPIQVIDTGTEPPQSNSLSEYYGRLCSFKYLGMDSDQLFDCFFTLYSMVVKSIYNETYPSHFSLKTFRTSPAVTKWSELVVSYLYHAREIVGTVKKHHNVLLQGGVARFRCETTLSCLAQLLLEPHYRTLDGFTELLRKEWITSQYSFGTVPPQRAPSSSLPPGVHEWDVQFFHFIYCVWVLVEYQPTHFEFGSELLLFLADASNEEQFGTFAFHDEAARRQLNAPVKTASIFHYILAHSERFANSTYIPTDRVIEPVVGSVNVWWNYFLRYSFLNGVSRAIATKVAMITFSARPVLVLERLSLSTIFPKDLLSSPSPSSPFFSPTTSSPLPMELGNLSLANNDLLSLPREILCLSELQVLNLSFNEIAKAPAILAFLPRLRSLQMKRNTLDDVSGVAWGRMTSLTTLNLDTNKLADFPAHLFENCTSLESLHLSSNHLSLLPSTLGCISSLTFLDISHNRLRCLPYAASSLRHLKYLTLSYNRLTHLPTSLSQLKELEVMNVEANKLSMLPDLPIGLNYLDASDNLLSFLPSNMGELMDLTVLKLTTNRLTSLPPSLVSCVSLQQLLLGSNLLDEIPSVVKEFRSLLTLDLRRNSLSSVPNWIVQLQALKTFNVSSNRLEDLPHTLGNMKKLESLVVRGNPLSNIPQEIVEGPSLKLIEYLRQLMGGSEASYRMKLMVVGQENVGKTSCIRAIAKDGNWSAITRAGSQPAPLDNLSTDGIDIRDYDITVRAIEFAKKNTMNKLGKALKGISRAKSRKDESKSREKVGDIHVNLNIWDFAGQEVYYTTHQLFLQNRCIYLIVFNLADPQAGARVHFWLQSLVSRVSNAPVLVVGTHLDDPSVATDRRYLTVLQEMRATHREQFPTLGKIRYFPISCTSEEGISDLRLSVQELIARQKHLGEEYPKSYLLLEALLKDRMSQYRDLPVMARSELLGMGSICGMKESSTVLDCAKFLSRIGTIIYFHDDPLLNTMVILDPQWLIDVMATLFSTKHSWVKDGILRHQDLMHIWKEYPQPIYPFLLHLFHRFQICYLLPKSQWSSAGQLLRPLSPRKRESSPAMQTNTLSFRRATTASKSTRTLSPSPSTESMRDLGRKLSSKVLAVNRSSALTDVHFAPLNRVAVSLVPALLRKEVPKKTILSLMPLSPQDHASTSPYRLQRLYSFGFLPFGLFPRVLVRLFELSTPIAAWASGYLGRTSLLKSDCILVTATSSADEKKTSPDAEVSLTDFMATDPEVIDDDESTACDTSVSILIDVRESNQKRCWSLMASVVDRLEEVMMAWPNLTCERFIFHPQDVKDKVDPPSRVNISLLEKAFLNGETTYDGFSIDQVVPDIALADYEGEISPFNLFILHETIGEGFYGKVRRATRRSKAEFALKTLTVNKEAVDAEKEVTMIFRALRRELLMQCTLDHPNIVKLYSVCLSPFALVFELVKGGNLYEFIHDNHLLTSPKLAIKMAIDLAQAIKYLHTQEIPMVHCDVKSPNVLVSLSDDPELNHRLKLADFGTARLLDGASLEGRHVENPLWLAPEIMMNENYNEKVDVYAFGVICYELLTLSKYFGHLSFMVDVEESVVAGRRPPLPNNIPIFARVIESCWAHHPTSRPSISSALAELLTIDEENLSASGSGSFLTATNKPQWRRIKHVSSNPSSPRSTSSSSSTSIASSRASSPRNTFLASFSPRVVPSVTSSSTPIIASVPLSPSSSSPSISPSSSSPTASKGGSGKAKKNPSSPSSRTRSVKTLGMRRQLSLGPQDLYRAVGLSSRKKSRHFDKFSDDNGKGSKGGGSGGSGSRSSRRLGVKKSRSRRDSSSRGDRKDQSESSVDSDKEHEKKEKKVKEKEVKKEEAKEESEKEEEEK